MVKCDYKGASRFNTTTVLLNVFINDIFYFIEGSIIYNYYDEYALSYSNLKIEKVATTLQYDSLE
jgi:hypothetical protein